MASSAKAATVLERNRRLGVANGLSQIPKADASERPLMGGTIGRSRPILLKKSGFDSSTQKFDSAKISRINKFDALSNHILRKIAGDYCASTFLTVSARCGHSPTTPSFMHLSASPDHPVGAGEQRGRDPEAECFGCLAIDYQIELGRLLDGQIAWLSSLQDLINVGRCTAI